MLVCPPVRIQPHRYVVNNDIPMCPAPLGIWDKVSGVGGDALNNLLGFGSTIFTTNLIVGACSAQAVFSGDWLRAIITAVVVGTAGSFFPLNKGFKLANSAEAANAMCIAFFLCSGGLGFVDTMVRNSVDIVLGQFLARFAAPCHPTRAVCDALRRAHAYRILIG